MQARRWSHDQYAPAYVQGDMDVDRLEEVMGGMGGWGGAWSLISPGINSQLPDDPGEGGWSGTRFNTQSVSATSSTSGLGMVGLGLGLALDQNGCGVGVDGSVGVEDRFAAWSFPTPPPSRRLCFAPTCDPPPPPATADPQTHPPPPLQQISLHPQHQPSNTTTLNRPRTAPAFSGLTRASAPWAPLGPSQQTLLRATPAFAFAVPELVVEELPDTWSTQTCPPTYAVINSPEVTYPLQAQVHPTALPTPTNAIDSWLYTPPATQQSARTTQFAPAPLAALPNAPMADSASAPDHSIPSSLQGVAATEESSSGSQTGASFPVPMTSPVLSDSLSSPRIETPRDLCQLPDGVYELDAAGPTAQTEPVGTDIQ
ncbi:unnamed protein product [Cutaneotrichosporon oleaginosum]